MQSEDEDVNPQPDLEDEDTNPASQPDLEDEDVNPPPHSDIEGEDANLPSQQDIEDEDLPVLSEVVYPVTPDNPDNGNGDSTGLSQKQLEKIEEAIVARLEAATDRLFRDAAAGFQQLLTQEVWEKLREDLPGIVQDALEESQED